MILTANYTFLNYLVLTLGFLLLDDRFFFEWMPRRLERPRQWLLHRLPDDRLPDKLPEADRLPDAGEPPAPAAVPSNALAPPQSGQMAASGQGSVGGSPAPEASQAIQALRLISMLVPATHKLQSVDYNPFAKGLPGASS